MNNLVYLKNDEPVCSSLQVAEKFGKRHADVMRSIDNLIKNDSTQNCVQCFKQSAYKDDTGKSNKMYMMNKDGFAFLVMGCMSGRSERLLLVICSNRDYFLPIRTLYRTGSVCCLRFP